MNLLVYLRISLTLVLMIKFGDSVTTQWDKLVSSKRYENTRLIMETGDVFKSLYTLKENPLTTTRIVCSKFCVNHSKCVGFNFFANNTHYVCEYLQENFCSQRQRIALQIWPGGTVWDKVRPGMTKACIDQQFENKTTANYCQIGRSGCRSGSNTSLTAWPECDNCVKTCSDCVKLNNISDQSADHNCTLWPDGPRYSPIFAFCKGNATFLLRRTVNILLGKGDYNYRMILNNMHRISRLKFYTTLWFVFGSNTTGYYTAYQNFYIDKKGYLMNMTFKSGTDGFNLKSKPLQASPWVNTHATCGSFWYLRPTQKSATLQCPGGDISMQGKVDPKVIPIETGLHWPEATQKQDILIYADIRMDL